MKNCMGCGACSAICPTQCIQMKLDAAGFLYPYVEETKCINCKKCENVCPISHNIVVEGQQFPSSYASKISDKEVLSRSTSGGIFPAIAKQWKGIVFGAVMQDDYSVVIEKEENYKNLNRMQGSKYVQSLTGDSYKQTKWYLENSKRVVYAGLPCQIAGLKSFLGKEYDALLCVDIVCHGCPSTKLFQDYISELEKEYGSIANYHFETKSRDWSPAIEKMVQFEANGKLYTRDFIEDAFLYSFVKEENYRPYCYHCKFSSLPRISDLTLGDYLGYGIITSKEIEPKNGISMVLVNTEKGVKCWNSLTNIEKQPVALKTCMITNHNLWKPTQENAKSKKYYERYIQEGFYKIKQETLKANQSVFVKIKKKIRFYFPRLAAKLIIMQKKKKSSQAEEQLYLLYSRYKKDITK